MFGKGSEEKTKPIYNQDQEALLSQLLGGLSGPLSSGLGNIGNILGGDQATFDAYFKPARRGFEEETLPGIAERFTGSLGEGSQRSSSFGQALGSAARDLEENIFSQRIGMQTDALAQLMNMFNPAMSPTQHQYTTNRQPGFLENAGLSFIGSGGIGSVLDLFGRRK